MRPKGLVLADFSPLRSGESRPLLRLVSAGVENRRAFAIEALLLLHEQLGAAKLSFERQILPIHKQEVSLSMLVFARCHRFGNA